MIVLAVLTTKRRSLRVECGGSHGHIRAVGHCWFMLRCRVLRVECRAGIGGERQLLEQEHPHHRPCRAEARRTSAERLQQCHPVSESSPQPSDLCKELAHSPRFPCFWSVWLVAAMSVY